MSRPRFSVITPFLAAEQYLGEAIASVVAQGFSDWEMLLVDDGSKDSGPDIARHWSSIDSRIRFLAHEHTTPRGAAAARNRGIEVARGEYLTFLDADDLYLPDRLSSHEEVLLANPGLVALYGRADWHFEGETKVRREYLGPFVNQTVQPPGLIRRVLLDHEGDVPCTSMVTLRRAEVIECGAFDERFQLYEDQTLWVKIFARYPVFVLDQCGAIYRQHSGSASAKAELRGDYHPSRPHLAGHAFLIWLRQYLFEANVRDRFLDQSLAWQLSVYEGNSRFYRFPVRSFRRAFRRTVGWIRSLLTRTG